MCTQVLDPKGCGRLTRRGQKTRGVHECRLEMRGRQAVREQLEREWVCELESERVRACTRDRERERARERERNNERERDNERERNSEKERHRQAVREQLKNTQGLSSIIRELFFEPPVN